MSLRLPRRASNGRKDATRLALLEAALNVFGEKGYHGAAVDDIVDRAGRSKGAAYFHFPSKAAIFRALVRELANQLVNSIQRKMDDVDSPAERLDAALLGLIDVFVRHRALARIVLIEVAGAGRAFSADLIFVRRQFADLIERELDRAMSKSAPSRPATPTSSPPPGSEPSTKSPSTGCTILTPDRCTPPTPACASCSSRAWASAPPR